MSLPRLKDVPRRSDGQVMCAAAFIAFRVRKESEIYIYSQVHTYRRSLEGYHSQSILVNFTCNLTASGGCLTIQEAQPLTIDNLAYMSVYTGFIKNCILSLFSHWFVVRLIIRPSPHPLPPAFLCKPTMPPFNNKCKGKNDYVMP